MSHSRASSAACEVAAVALDVASVAAGAIVSVMLPVLSRFTPPHSPGIDTASARPDPAPSDAHAPFQGQCSSSLTTRCGGPLPAAESSQAPRSRRPVPLPLNLAPDYVRTSSWSHSYPASGTSLLGAGFRDSWGRIRANGLGLGLYSTLYHSALQQLYSFDIFMKCFPSKVKIRWRMFKYPEKLGSQFLKLLIATMFPHHKASGNSHDQINYGSSIC